jgi:hypothetical protein
MVVAFFVCGLLYFCLSFLIPTGSALEGYLFSVLI